MPRRAKRRPWFRRSAKINIRAAKKKLSRAVILPPLGHRKIGGEHHFGPRPRAIFRWSVAIVLGVVIGKFQIAKKRHRTRLRIRMRNLGIGANGVRTSY